MRNFFLLLLFTVLCGIVAAFSLHLWALAPNWQTLDYIGAGLTALAAATFVSSLPGKASLVAEARPGEDNSRFNESVMPPKFSEHDRPRTAGQAIKKTHH